MEASQFTALEYFALLYDIGIDEEDYNNDEPQQRGKLRIEADFPEFPSEWYGTDGKLRPLPIRLTLLPGENREYAGAWTPGDRIGSEDGWLETLVGCSDSFLSGQCEPGSLDDSWRRLLVAKRARCFLQERDIEHAGVELDLLALALTRSLPADPAHGGDVVVEHEWQVLRVLYFNEIAACYNGYHAIAHATDCLDYIRKLAGKKESPHELVAQYNKAQGYFHAREHETAYARFAELAEFVLTSQDAGYFQPGTGAAAPSWRFPNEHMLFLYAVGLPAAFMAAESLFKLQRSTEAVEWLDRWLKNARAAHTIPSYWILRAQVMACRARVDRFDRSSLAATRVLVDPDEQDMLSLSGALLASPSYRHGKRNTLLQSFAVATELNQKICETAADALAEALKSECNAEQQPADGLLAWDATGFTALESVRVAVEARYRESGSDKSEKDQAVFHWIDGLSCTAAAIAAAAEALESVASGAPMREVIAEGAVRSAIEIMTLGGAYWSCEVGPAGDMRALAKNLCGDVVYRPQKLEARRKLLPNLQALLTAVEPIEASLLSAGEIEVRTGVGVSPAFLGGLTSDALRGEVRGLAAHLIDQFSEPDERGCLRVKPEVKDPPKGFELQEWLELRVLFSQDGSVLPVDAESAGTAGQQRAVERRHETLRRLLAQEFVRCRRDSEAGRQQVSLMHRVLGGPRRRFSCVVAGGRGCRRRSFRCLFVDDDRNCVRADEAMRSNPSVTFDEYGHASHYYDGVIARNQKQIANRLYAQRKKSEESSWYLCVLQRWNSYTPAMAASDGGGYFLYRTAEDGLIDYGVVIDPGYGFVRNFLGEGFGICDVNMIVVTHDHPDHLDDFQALVNLALEASKGRSTGPTVGQQRGHKLHAVLSEGAFSRLRPAIESAAQQFYDTWVITSPPNPALSECVRLNLEDFVPNGHEGGTLTVRARPALHKPGRDDAIGLVIKAADSLGGERQDFQIDVPSDTKWTNGVSGAYSESASSLSCLHLGSLTPDGAGASRFSVLDYFSESKTSREVLGRKWHLYLPGVVWFIDDLMRAYRGDGHKLVVLSEFGEELSGGLRVDLARKLASFFETRYANLTILPGDIGLTVDLAKKTLRCSCCGQYSAWSTPFAPEVHGESEGIFYVCSECMDVLSIDQRHECYKKHELPLHHLVADI
ncbi:MAG: hypothetical protein Q8K99_10960 [Actinomycetota bacterium]|nr:hypothetical protein [Actinomycetota bacterium]